MGFTVLTKDDLLPIGRETPSKQVRFSASAVPSTPSVASGTHIAACGKSPYSRYFDGTPCNTAAPKDLGCFGASPLSRWLEGSPIAAPGGAWAPQQPMMLPVDGCAAPMPMMFMVPLPCQWGPAPQDLVQETMVPIGAGPVATDTAAVFPSQQTFQSYGPSADCVAPLWPGVTTAGDVHDVDATSTLLSSSNPAREGAVHVGHEESQKSRTSAGIKQKARSTGISEAKDGPKAVFVDLSKLRPVGTPSQPIVVPPKVPLQIASVPPKPPSTQFATAPSKNRFGDAPWRKGGR